MSGSKLVERREALALLAAATLGGTTGAAGPARAAGAGSTYDLASRLNAASARTQLEAFAKVFVSLRAETVWYWYTGAMHASRPGQPVVSLLACDTLIRRDVLPQKDGSFGVRTFEANYFHPFDDPRPLRSFLNVLNGREVEPLHYREGPHVLMLTERAPRFVAGTEPRAAAGGADAAPFALHWQQAGPVVWTTRETHTDRPHPLDPQKWRLESSGPRMSFGSYANYFAPAAEIESRDVACTDCSFAYQALMGWWPWMLMGAAPGALLWRAHGRKLRSLDEVPVESRSAFESLHPRLFAKDLPWTEPASLWTDFPRQRTPVER